MKLLLLWLFWTSVALIVYTYIVFPILVFLRGLLSYRPYKSAEITPEVSLIIAAYNEAYSIGAKLDNVLCLDYPYDRLQVLVASDGSDDGTNAIVGRYSSRGIDLLVLPRQGKAPALNAAVAAATGEILIFSDANSIYVPDAIRNLVRPFVDPDVGGVAGNQRYLPGHNSDSVLDGERKYWRFDRKLKESQSRAGNAISATGAIYAIRRSLFHSVPAGVTDDFVTSTSVIAQGYRLVFAPDAIAYEPAAKSGDQEFRRKVRVITRGLRAVLVMRQLLNPFHYGFYAVQLFSHKVLRRLVAFPLLLILLINPLLWQEGLIYQVMMIAQYTFYGCAVLGMLLCKKEIGQPKFFALPYFFCMVNVASLLATVNVLRGRRIELWEPQRPSLQQESSKGVTKGVTLSVPPEKS